MSKRIDPQVRDVYGRLWHYVTPHKLIGFIAVVGMTATAIVEAGLVYLLQPLMDDTLVAKQVESGRWIPLAFMGIFILRGLSGFATEASLGWIGRSVISDLRRQVFNKFLTLPVRFFDGQAAGPLLSKLTYNVEMVAESVTSVVTIAVRDILTVIAAIGVMLYHSPALTVFVAILFPIVGALVWLLGIAFRRYSSRIQDSVGAVTQVTDEIIRGNTVVKAFGGYEYERDRLAEVDEGNRKQNLKLIRVRSMGVAVTQVVFGFGIALVIFIAGKQSIDGVLSPGQFISFFSAMMLMLQPVRRITNVNATLQRGVAGADSLFRIIDEQDESDTGSYDVERVQGRVRFDNVGFSYGDADGPVIDKLSVSIGAGQTLAIVGHSGSGKSTLVSLLPRFYEVGSGDIFIDDISIRDYKLGSLRNNISLVSQDVVLFNDTIRNNLAYGQLKSRSDEELMKAAEAAHILDFTNELPDGLETMVGDRG
ncbi:MAG: ABC transporter transmembrane domain-containing protein, partial [Gammaproteobacteria bacterium]|nr:ABC transporter transmembrane domain-containing protein [Gammaproteobacteria bacterium]